jgi:predicted RNA-binding protein (TIGR00451 family)
LVVTNIIMHPISKKEVEELRFYLDHAKLDRKSHEVWSAKLLKNVYVFLIDRSTPLLVSIEGTIIPFIEKAKLFEDVLSVVHIDDGAIARIENGADVMAPGVTRINEKSSGPVIVESQSDKVVAIGVFFPDWKENMSSKKGKVVQNLHNRQDRIYKIIDREMPERRTGS